MFVGGAGDVMGGREFSMKFHFLVQLEIVAVLALGSRLHYMIDLLFLRLAGVVI